MELINGSSLTMSMLYSESESLEINISKQVMIHLQILATIPA